MTQNSSIVRRERLRQGLTLDELAQRCGVSRQTICHAQNRAEIPLRTALALSRALGIPASLLNPAFAEAAEKPRII